MKDVSVPDFKDDVLGLGGDSCADFENLIPLGIETPFGLGFDFMAAELCDHIGVDTFADLVKGEEVFCPVDLEVDCIVDVLDFG